MPDVYQKLRERLDMFPQGFPKTESGVEMEILRDLFTEEEALYFLAPWVVGIWEFQVKNLNSENIQLYEKYHNEAIVPERRRSKTAGFRVIPVEEEVQANPEVESIEKVSEIIESSTRFAVADCICRKEAAFQ